MSALPVEFDPVPVQGLPALPVPVVPVLVPSPSDAPEPAVPGAPASGMTVPGEAVPDAAICDTPAEAAPRPRSADPGRSGLRARPLGRRSRAVGVRACSAVSLAEVPAVPGSAAPQWTAPGRAVPPRPVQAPARLVQDRTAVASPRLRLTARGRAAVAACGVVVATLLWFAVATAAHAAAHGAPAAPAQPALTKVVVQPGQTLWSIATQADPSADPRLVVQRIVTVNKLTGESVAAGQRLWVPRG